MDSIQRGADSMSVFEHNLDLVGNNLANLQTTGYRAQRVTYDQSATGHVTGTLSVDPRGGQLQATHVPTDAAIQGDGFFIIQGPDGPLYTRDGSFHMDPQGNLLFGDQGLAVMGYGARNGFVDDSAPVAPVRIPLGRQTVSHGSTAATASGNLDASASAYVAATDTTAESGGVLRTQATLDDSLGIPHTVSFTFTKTGTNAWHWTATLDDGSSLSPPEGDISFDSSGEATPPSVTLTLAPGGGAAQGQAVTLDFSGLTQRSGASDAVVSGDTFQSGTLSSFSVGTDGTITGTYSDGTNAVLGRIPLARFSNPAGLRQLDGNLLAGTGDSGVAQVGVAGSGSFGTIEQGNLEGSNVDMTVEFSRMIMAQRAYQANSRLIRTGDEMWQDLLDLKR
jgi:flagellar hook protein FlgE